MAKQRLDIAVAALSVISRSQAETFIRLGEVTVNNNIIKKSGYSVSDTDVIMFNPKEQYVSRAGLKLASVAQTFKLDFRGKTVLDVGSSTGGFTDYALQHRAAKVIAVDVGTNQLHPKLRPNSKVELHEQTDIRDMKKLSSEVDYVVIDVSFISQREILPTVARLSNNNTLIVAMVKPQFEAGSDAKHKGVIKNEKMRRDILKNYESWVRESFKIIDKADSQVTGEKGNKERFYLLSVLS